MVEHSPYIDLLSGIIMSKTQLKPLGQSHNDWTRKDFISFLQSTLIPDLRDSGLDATADDFDTAIFFMKRDE